MKELKQADEGFRPFRKLIYSWSVPRAKLIIDYAMFISLSIETQRSQLL